MNNPEAAILEEEGVNCRSSLTQCQTAKHSIKYQKPHMMYYCQRAAQLRPANKDTLKNTNTKKYFVKEYFSVNRGEDKDFIRGSKCSVDRTDIGKIPVYNMEKAYKKALEEN